MQNTILGLKSKEECMPCSRYFFCIKFHFSKDSHFLYIFLQNLEKNDAVIGALQNTRMGMQPLRKGLPMRFTKGPCKHRIIDSDQAIIKQFVSDTLAPLVALDVITNKIMHEGRNYEVKYILHSLHHSYFIIHNTILASSHFPRHHTRLTLAAWRKFKLAISNDVKRRKGIKQFISFQHISRIHRF